MEAAFSGNDANNFELSPEAQAQVDLKFTYVVTCQIYGIQKKEKRSAAEDIRLLMQRWWFDPLLRPFTFSFYIWPIQDFLNLCNLNLCYVLLNSMSNIVFTFNQV